MTSVVLIAYVVGAILGRVAAGRSGFGRVWPSIVRAQVLIAAILLSITSVWRINSIDSVLWPLLMVLSIGLMSVIAYLTWHSPNRAARTSLQTWAANANTAFFVIPVGTAFGGATGAAAAVLMDRMAVPLYSWWIHLLRRGAPTPQQTRTSFVDQAPLIAVGLGLLLHLTGPAPEWTATITLIAAPVLAASGAAIFVGSVLHPTQRIDPRPGVRRWLALVGVRMALFIPIAVFAPTTDLRVVAVLCALSIPAFAAPQMSTVYGYADPVVAAGSRYGWIIGGVGLVTAVLVTR